MLKQEWKSLFHNKILLLVVIVIALIPAIYAGLFLASMWDPYGNVDKLPVAIVNEDEPAEYGDTTLTVGDQLVDNLKENDSLAFNFVDADVAKEGLKNGTYYMVITIPKATRNTAPCGRRKTACGRSSTQWFLLLRSFWAVSLP